jgi:hypothetical protein
LAWTIGVTDGNENERPVRPQTDQVGESSAWDRETLDAERTVIGGGGAKARQYPWRPPDPDVKDEDLLHAQPAYEKGSPPPFRSSAIFAEI